MKRLSVVLLIAIVAVACTGHKDASTPSTTVGATTTSILPEGTWTFGSGGAGFAVGEMHITGGERPRNGEQHDQAVPGTIDVHHPGETRVLTSVAVGSSGRFKIDLPAGNYVLVARPTNRGLSPWTSQPFVINVGGTAHVDLLELAT